MFKKIKKFLLTILGDIKVYKFPFFIVYAPDSYKIKGKTTRAALKVLRPGDIILRKYIHYLDGYFIPGKYSHTGVYVGNGTVIHAVAEGVSEIDVIDFLRCDGFCILRQSSKPLAEHAVNFAKTALNIKSEYDFDFAKNNNELYCHELGVNAYLSLNIEKKPVKFLWFNLEPRYLADSFLENKNFKIILEA